MTAPEPGELFKLELRTCVGMHSARDFPMARRIVLPHLAWVLVTIAVLSPFAALAQSPSPTQTTTSQTKSETTQTVITPERLRLGVNSLWFTSAGLVLGIVVLSIIWRFSEPASRYTDFFADGQFVQLVVIIMVAGNVCSLGIMGILEKGEIATIYAGIVGYILGKRVTPGVGVDKGAKPLTSAKSVEEKKDTQTLTEEPTPLKKATGAG
jgi:hypothetical protein